jgi:osmotically-inducible protein OsmY
MLRPQSPACHSTQEIAMKNPLVLALILGLAACGEKHSLAPVAQAAAPQPVAMAIEPEKVDADKELAQRVMRTIDEAKILGIDARVADGVVTLWGTTLSAGDRSRAGEIAAHVDGVKAVDNRLQIVTGS